MRPAIKPPKPRPSIIRLDGSGTGVPPLEEEEPPPVEPVDVLVEPPWPDDPQPELPHPELLQPLTVPRVSDDHVASAGALAATAIAATPARIAHFINFKMYLHSEFVMSMNSKAIFLPDRRSPWFHKDRMVNPISKNGRM